jgi:NADH dehydrogenase [ubiquinone] 1 alpha subcomplex assembly factor 3
VVILGCGRSTRPVPKPLSDELAAKGIAMEAMDTPNAVATFNILNQEGRSVLGAFLPLADH